jgi:hypothetical protein
MRALKPVFPQCSLHGPITIAAIMLLMLIGPAPAVGQATNPVVRVEEDWQLALNEPNDSVASPQFHTIMSASGALSSYYAEVTWNYSDTPSFIPGGLQLHSWSGDTLVKQHTVRPELLSTTAETITWTQALETDGTTLYFDILDGNSVTWGWFGRDMRISEQANLPDLSGYSPAVSVANSAVTYGANRVNMLMIREVRYYTATGRLAATDYLPRIVFRIPRED